MTTGIRQLDTGRWFLADEAATTEVGHRLAEVAGEGGLVFLEGQLGAGKTCLARGILAGLGHAGAVKSPTYTLVEPYTGLRPAVFHFDLYRLGDPEELEFMGIRDYIQKEHLCLVEWPERGRGWLPQADLRVRLMPSDEGREMWIVPGTGPGEAMKRRLESVMTSGAAQP